MAAGETYWADHRITRILGRGRMGRGECYPAIPPDIHPCRNYQAEEAITNCQTMDDFEYASESGTLPSFLKQDTDLAGNTSIGEAELERLMREMSDSDLDALAAEVGKVSGDTGGVGKIGLVTPSGAVPAGSAGDREVVELSGEESGVDSAGKGEAGLPSGSISRDKDKPATTDPVKGISSAAQQTVETITSKASNLISSLGGAEPHSGTADDNPVRSPSSPSTSSTTKTPSTGTSDSAIADTPTSGRSPTTSQNTPASPIVAAAIANAKSRRLSKEEIAAEMMKADSVEGLLASLNMAEGKEKVD